MKIAKIGCLVVMMLSPLAWAMDGGGHPPPDSSKDVVIQWFDLVLKLTKESSGYQGPVAARSFGYISVALYEAIVPGNDQWQSLVGQLNELEAFH